MATQWKAPDGGALDLDYFVDWRPWLWREPVHRAMTFLSPLSGRRILEIGGCAGKMTCFMALQGAQVTMIDKAESKSAPEEVRKWNVGDRVRLIRTDGGLEALAGQTFDAIFTKSVLWSVEHLEDFLRQLNRLLAPGGQVAFVENYRGGPMLMWLRSQVIHRKQFGRENWYFGIRPDQLAIFRDIFQDVEVRRHRFLVYSITGRKRS